MAFLNNKHAILIKSAELLFLYVSTLTPHAMPAYTVP